MARTGWVCLAFALLLLPSFMPAQTLDSFTNAETIRKDVNEVNLTFTVTDGKGRFVTGLTQDSFSILDDHRPPASVKRFQSLTDLPLRICIVFDASDSISRYVKFQQEVAIRFLKNVLRPGVDQACLVKFAATPVLAQDFTDDLTGLEDAIQNATASGATAVWDALRFTTQAMGGNTGSDRVRRVIVLITDGDDNSSTTTFDEAVNDLLHREVAVEAVGTIDHGMWVDLLRKLANTTGGHLWSGGNAKQLARAMMKIEESLRSEYFVAYEPAGELSPGRFRSIRVKAKRRRGKIAHRSGYFVPRGRALMDTATDP